MTSKTLIETLGFTAVSALTLMANDTVSADQYSSNYSYNYNYSYNSYGNFY
ncbi:hypothetical protein STPL106120_05755 [Streptococcus pluranimalium]